jgi:hypothetical protein
VNYGGLDIFQDVAQIHVTLHARPDEAVPGPKLSLGGLDIETLCAPQSSLATSPLSVNFEHASEALSQLPRMFVEPDGSFVWVSPAGEPVWQMEGCLYDRSGSLLFVELRGSCPVNQFQRLLAAFGRSKTPPVFQLVREGVLVEEKELLRLLADRAS